MDVIPTDLIALNAYSATGGRDGGGRRDDDASRVSRGSGAGERNARRADAKTDTHRLGTGDPPG